MIKLILAALLGNLPYMFLGTLSSDPNMVSPNALAYQASGLACVVVVMLIVWQARIAADKEFATIVFASMASSIAGISAGIVLFSQVLPLVNSHIYHMGYPDILTQRIGQAAFGLTSSAVITLAVCKHTKRQGRQVDANRDRR